MGPSNRFTHVMIYIGLFGFIQVLYLGRAPRIKETLPDFLKWRRIIRHPLVFRGLTGSQRTPRFAASQRGFSLANYCLLCSNDEESIDHLCLNCPRINGL